MTGKSWLNRSKGARPASPEWKDTEISTNEARPTPAPKPAVRARQAAKPVPHKSAISLLQLFRRKPLASERLPPATFSRTSHGIRSLVVDGFGSPTVVFESGLGHGKRAWATVFNAISQTTRAVAYDRAGYGQSEASAQSRDGLQVVLELRDMLLTEDIRPPYVLVGHSLGGTMVKLFAKTYPDDVAGVVLVDARHAEFTQRCRQLGVPRLLYDPPEALLSMMPPSARAELEAASLTLKQTRRAGRFPDVPLIVLTQSSATSRWPGGLGKVWEASQRQMAKMSRLGRIKVLSDAGHNVHIDRPDVVIRAVLGVVEAARHVARHKKMTGL